MQNSVISTRITSLHGSQTSPVVFECKTTTLGPETRVCIGPRPHLWFFLHSKQRLSTRIASLYGSQPSSVVLYTHNSDIMTRINSLNGSQTSPVVMCMQNSVISSRNTSLHGSQTSPVVLYLQTNVIILRITSLYGSQPSFLYFFHAKQRLLDQNYNSLCFPDFVC